MGLVKKTLLLILLTASFLLAHGQEFYDQVEKALETNNTEEVFFYLTRNGFHAREMDNPRDDNGDVTWYYKYAKHDKESEKPAEIVLEIIETPRFRHSTKKIITFNLESYPNRFSTGYLEDIEENCTYGGFSYTHPDPKDSFDSIQCKVYSHKLGFDFLSYERRGKMNISVTH